MKKTLLTVKLICKANLFFKKFVIIFRKYNLTIKYLNKYSKVKLSVKQKLNLLLYSVGFNLIKKQRLFPKCTVKSSKIIIYEKDDYKSQFIFDRPISKDYWELRNKWSEFHFSPNYIKIDELPRQSY